MPYIPVASKFFCLYSLLKATCTVATTLQVLFKRRDTCAWICEAAFSPNDEMFVLAAADKKIYIYDNDASKRYLGTGSNALYTHIPRRLHLWISVPMVSTFRAPAAKVNFLFIIPSAFPAQIYQMVDVHKYVRMASARTMAQDQRGG